MEALLHQILAGLATGGIYASLALALVMIYQATHLVNFAQGEMAMFTTYIAWSLVMSISERVVALNFGKVIAQGTPAEVRRHPELMRAYLGAA